MEDALTLKDDEGSGVTALSFGEPSSRLWSGDFLMGKPNCVNHNYSAQAGSIPGEVKHLSSQRKRNRIDTVSSGERTRHSLNHLSVNLLIGEWGNRDETSSCADIDLRWVDVPMPIFVLYQIGNWDKGTRQKAQGSTREQCRDRDEKLQIRTLAERPWNGRPKKVIVL